MAIEFNGIHHYKPIYGQSKLERIQKNDRQKIKSCQEKNIELYIYDISSIKCFTPKKGISYLEEITDLIYEKAGSTRIELVSTP